MFLEHPIDARGVEEAREDGAAALVEEGEEEVIEQAFEAEEAFEGLGDDIGLVERVLDDELVAQVVLIDRILVEGLAWVERRHLEGEDLAAGEELQQVEEVESEEVGAFGRRVFGEGLQAELEEGDEEEDESVGGKPAQEGVVEFGEEEELLEDERERSQRLVAVDVLVHQLDAQLAVVLVALTVLLQRYVDFLGMEFF